jgi:hypothetical protein
MQFYRARMVVEKRTTPGLSTHPLHVIRMWTLGGLVAAFLLGLVIGVALGYGARALRVPGFVLRVSLVRRAPRRTPVAMRAAVERSQGRVGGAGVVARPAA